MKEVFASFDQPERSWVLQAAEYIRSGDGSVRIEDIAGEFSLSRRQFERKFRQFLGFSPKQYSKIVRIAKARRLIHSLQPETLTHVGYECDYYDQAHFIREFQGLVKMTPRQYQKKREMSRLYNY